VENKEKMTVTIGGQEHFENKVLIIEGEGWRSCSHIKCAPNKAAILFKGKWRNKPTNFIFSQDFVRFDSEDLKYLNEQELKEFNLLIPSEEKASFIENHNRYSNHGKCCVEMWEKFDNDTAKAVLDKFF